MKYLIVKYLRGLADLIIRTNDFFVILLMARLHQLQIQQMQRRYSKEKYVRSGICRLKMLVPISALFSVAIVLRGTLFNFFQPIY